MADLVALDIADQYAAYAPKIRAYVYRRTSDLALADDLTQETFCRALDAKRRGFGPTSHVSGWLHRIAHNLVIDWYRYRDKAFVGSFEAMTESVARDNPNPAMYGGRDTDLWVVDPTDYEARCIGRLDALDALGVGAAAMTREQATVFYLRSYIGYRFEEIGEMLHTTTGAVKALHHRARKNARIGIAA